MTLELDLHEKYAEKLEEVEDIDPSVRERLIMHLESEAMERITALSSQAEQAQQAQPMGDEAEADD